MKHVAERLVVLAVAVLLAVGCDRNHPPERPGAPRGPGFALPHINYLFNVRTDDLDGDSVSFCFDWGDGHWSDWGGPVRFDSFAMVAHTWEDTGRYLVRVQARDEHLSLSAWSDQSTVSVREGQVAPDFVLPCADGRDSARLYPRLTVGPVLIVWWDLPNVMGIAEIDSLQPLLDTFAPRGFGMLALSLDKSEDDTLVGPFAWNRGWNCPVLLDSERTAAAAYGLTGIPTTVLVSMDTTIVYAQHGYYKGDKEAIEMQVLQWLPSGQQDVVK